MSGRERAKTLVVEARRTARIAERLRLGGTPAPDLEAALDATYRDLGRLLVHDPEVVALLAPLLPELEVAVAEGFTDELPAAEEEGWYEPDPTDPRPGPFFAPEDFVGAGDLPLPERLPIPPDGAEDEDEVDVETPELLVARSSLPGSALGAFRAGGDGIGWMNELAELLELLRAPFDLDDPTELGVEASRVQWATTELDARTRNLPDDVTTALVGLLAARAQHLRHRLDVDVGARRSLERLERFRADRRLPLVTGLLPTPVPETHSWDEDAERWWAVFYPPPEGA